jgi:hypothetical protein
MLHSGSTSHRFISVANLGVFTLGLGLTPAIAAKGDKKAHEKAFGKLDKNGDGSLTLEEMKEKGKKEASKVEERFKKLDKDGYGKISLAEPSARGKNKK